MTMTRSEYYATPCVALWINAHVIMPHRTITRCTDNIKLPLAFDPWGTQERLELRNG